MQVNFVVLLFILVFFSAMVKWGLGFGEHITCHYIYQYASDSSLALDMKNVIIVLLFLNELRKKFSEISACAIHNLLLVLGVSLLHLG